MMKLPMMSSVVIVVVKPEIARPRIHPISASVPTAKPNTRVDGAQNGDDAKRGARERDDGGRREIHQLPQGPLTLTFCARLDIERNARVAEADPVDQAAVEALTFRQVPGDGVDDATIEQLEIRRIPKIDAAEPRQHRIEEPGSHSGERTVALAAPLDRIDDHGALAPFLDHRRDQLRRMLQIGVNRDHRVAARSLEAGEQRRLLAKIAREPEPLDAGILPGQILHPIERRVATAVVDHDDLQVHRAGRERVDYHIHGVRDAGRFVVRGNHHAQSLRRVRVHGSFENAKAFCAGGNAT